MAVDKNKLKSKMVLHGDTIKSLSTKIGISRNNLSSKINGKLPFISKEIAVIVNLYNLTPEETTTIFGLKNECS